MNFSDCIEHSGGVVEYSPDGRMVALSKAFDVFVSKPLLSSIINNKFALVSIGVRDRNTEALAKIPVPRSNFKHHLVQ
jgi:hypothetical protein